MVSMTALLKEAGDQLDGLLVFALVPFALSLANPTNLRKVADSGADFRLGVSFGFPTTVATSWNFLSLPADGVSPTVPPDALVSFLPVAGGGTLLMAVLGTVYLGAMERELAGHSHDPLADLRTYLRSMVGFELLRLVCVLAVALAASVSVALAVGMLVFGLVLVYLFYPVPYLIVLTGSSLRKALGRSYAETSAGGAYGSFFLRYAFAVAAVSVVATPLFTTNTLGAILGAAFLAPVCVLFNGATLAFVRETVGIHGGDGESTQRPFGHHTGPAFHWPDEH